MHVQVRYPSVALAVASTSLLPNNAIAVASFICVTAGTLTIIDSTGLVRLNAFPASAGVTYQLEMLIGLGGSVVLGTGCSGTLTYDS